MPKPADLYPTLEAQFLGYCNLVFDVPAESVPEAQIREMRRAFFAGAVMFQGQVLGLMGQDPGDLTEEELAAVEALVEQYNVEIEKFAEHELAGLMRTEGSA